jgi:Helix-turn-helix domain
MAREVDYYTVDEAARILGMSPARVRQTLRSGELEGKRREERIEGVLGPWRIPARAVQAFQERLKAGAEETTVALSPDEEATADTLSGTLEPTSGEITAGTPSEASEKLSEEVRELREMAKALLGEIDRIEGRLEATEVEQFTLREALRREKGQSEQLRAELEAERAGRRGEWRRTSRRPFGGRHRE